MNKNLYYSFKKIKNFYYYCLFRYTLRKVEKTFCLDGKKYLIKRKLSIKRWKVNLNKILELLYLIYKKKTSLTLNKNVNRLKCKSIYFAKKNLRPFLFVLKNFIQFITFFRNKNLYSIYFSNFYFKEKNFFIITKASYKCYLCCNKYYKNDLFNVIKKIVFFTTEI